MNWTISPGATQARPQTDCLLGNPYIRTSLDTMPPDNSSEPLQHTTIRKRAPSERVVPVIPLALSKPKPSKTNKRKESDVRVGVEQETSSGDALNIEQKQESLLNGGNESPEEANDTHSTDIADAAVRMPSNGTFGTRPRARMSISIGGMAETPTTPPPVEQPPVAATPPSARKPTDNSFGMRSISTELPPLAPTFIPSAEQHTPRSAGSSQSNRPPSHLYNNTFHPAANGLMFGSHDSSTSSPAPPLSAGLTFVPPPYNNMPPPQHPYYVPHSHAHHSSEPHFQRMYQPMYPQQKMPWNLHQAYGQHIPQAAHYHPHNNMAFRYPPRDAFTPSDPHLPNGHHSPSRSASQASSVGQDQKTARNLHSPLSPENANESAPAIPLEPKAAFPGHAHPRPSHLNHQMPPPLAPPYPPPEVASNIDNAEALRPHIFAQFNDPSFADCRLVITDESNSEQHSFDAHRIIISRSSTLLELIPSSESSESPREIHIPLAGKYLRFDAFADALRYIYGGPLLQIDHQRPGSSAGERFPSNVERMEHALRYTATGAWLKLPPIAARGVDVAGGLLHWDTISTALAFALDGGLSQLWNVEDGSEDRASTSSSDDSLRRPETMFTPTYDPYATNLLQRIVDFTVHVFPPNFYLDASAPQLETCPRLPTLPLSHESRQSRSDPRLSQIRFGEIPIEDHQRPSFATTTISSVLLSLPFQLLKCVLEHYDLAARLGPETVASIMRQVVAERETRRNRVLKARTASQLDDTTDAQLVQNLYWQESVEPSTQHRAGFRLARRKRDIDTPPSSGACSERNK